MMRARSGKYPYGWWDRVVLATGFLGATFIAQGCLLPGAHTGGVGAGPKTCQFDTDCSPGNKCVKQQYALEGVCANSYTGAVEKNTCNGDYECGIGKKCFKQPGQYQGVCVDRSTYDSLPHACTFDLDCGIGRLCMKTTGQLEGRCVSGERVQRAVRARCDLARQACRRACSYATVEDEATGMELDGTDFESKCSDACDRGSSGCEDETAVESACDEFKASCQRACPSDVYDYGSGDYKYETNAESECRDACRAGERACPP